MPLLSRQRSGDQMALDAVRREPWQPLMGFTRVASKNRPRVAPGQELLRLFPPRRRFGPRSRRACIPRGRAATPPGQGLNNRPGRVNLAYEQIISGARRAIKGAIRSTDSSIFKCFDTSRQILSSSEWYFSISDLPGKYRGTSRAISRK